jgi:uncharacterized coiled-coil protein SlyX
MSNNTNVADFTRGRIINTLETALAEERKLTETLKKELLLIKEIMDAQNKEMQLLSQELAAFKEDKRKERARFLAEEESLLDAMFGY